MDPILAAGVLSLGRQVVEHILPSPKTAQAPDFQQVLNAQTATTARPGMAASPLGTVDVAGLARRIRSAEHSLGNTAEVSGFLRGATSFHLKSDGEGFVIERPDGATLKLTAGSAAEDIARQLDGLKQQQKSLVPHPAVAGAQTRSKADEGWLVSLPIPAQRSSRV